MKHKETIYSRLCISPAIRLVRLRSQTMTKIYTPYNLSGLQVGVLQMLYTSDGSMQKDICDSMAVAPSAMVRILAPLEDHHLIKRIRSEKNRSVINVFITEEGRSLAEEMQSVVIQTENEYLNELSMEERDQLRHLLTKALLSWAHTADKADKKDSSAEDSE